MDIPTLRFPLFSQEWEIKKLSEVSKIGRGKSKHRPRDAAFLYGGNYPFVQTGDIKNADLYLLNYKQTYSEAGLKQSKLWDINTLCITIAANIAETSILKVKACFPDSIIGLIPFENEYNVEFIKYQFDKYKIEIKRLSQGVAQDNLNQEKLSNLEFVFPSFEEQTKIAEFLISIDEKINLLKEKKSLLEDYKKGIMQQIFNQKIKFKDENGNDFEEWETKSLNEVATKKSSSISANKIEDNFGKYIIYGASGILKKVDFYTEEEEYISIIKDGAGVGRLFYCEGKTSVLGTMDIIKPNKILNTYFLYCLLSNIDFVKYVAGSTIPHIYFKDYSKEVCGIPSLKEQIKISNFLLAIDEKIELVNTQITETNEYKKGLLQQMFV